MTTISIIINQKKGIKIERHQDKESCEAFEQWCEEMEGLKESAFKAGFEAALIWIKEIIMERTVEQKAEEHNKYYYK